MAQDIRRSREEDRAAVHHFIRLVGRAPTDEELAEFLRGSSGRTHRASLRSLGLRYRAARLIVRL
ncbi:hypothetical protein ACFFOS_07820 [Nocardioides kongjuensis]|uniref:Uncharacterized protein n=1 Tax=Nocardioides kongjuensis TaxID=349522 RepID=A0A852RI25_9ACTN|nr:hypothetical protein [Nocardioides kongjuensis]NYD33077.1 hypothetical protein [Nocardioides kongjuensis]